MDEEDASSMAKDEMRDRIAELEAEVRRRERKMRKREDRIIGHAISGLCANPSFMNPESNSEENTAGLVETAIAIAVYLTAAEKADT